MPARRASPRRWPRSMRRPVRSCTTCTSRNLREENVAAPPGARPASRAATCAGRAGGATARCAACWRDVAILRMLQPSRAAGDGRCAPGRAARHSGRGGRMAVRRFVVVGLGNFGSGVVEMLHARGQDVIAVDVDERKVERVRALATRAAVVDATDARALDRIGADGADAAVVSVGTDLATSVLAVLALQDVHVGEIYAKATSAEHAQILERLGVTEVIRPERETALRLATRLSMRLLNYLPIAVGYSLQEVPTPDEFAGRTLVELQLPQRYGV